MVKEDHAKQAEKPLWFEVHRVSNTTFTVRCELPIRRSVLSYTLILVCATVAVLCLSGLIAVILRKSHRASKSTSTEPLYTARGALLTPAERSFYGVLRCVIPSNLVIFAKVRLSDLIEPRDQDGRLDASLRQTALNKISSKHIDFVVCDAATTDVVCCIELDDRSHQRGERRSRDSFVESALAFANVRLLRFKVAHSYTMEAVRAELTRAGVGVTKTVSGSSGASACSALGQDDSKYMPPPVFSRTGA